MEKCITECQHLGVSMSLSETAGQESSGVIAQRRGVALNDGLFSHPPAGL
jgi:hypothetical protein